MTTRRCFLALALALLPLAAFAQETQPPPTQEPVPVPAAEWKEFQAKQGRFSVLLPGTPEYLQETRDIYTGPITLHRYLLRTDGRLYLVVYADFPFSEAPQGALGALDDFQNGVLSSLKARLLSERDMKVYGKPGKEIRAETDAGVLVQARAVLVGRRMYEVLVAAPRAESRSPDLKRFLDSFKLTAPAKPAPKEPAKKRK